MISPPDRLLIVPWASMPGKALPDPLRVTYQLILSLAWAHDRQRTPPISRRELARMRGIGLRTLDTHLRMLRDAGWIQNDPHSRERVLVLLPRHLSEELAAIVGGPAAADTPPQSASPPPTAGRATDGSLVAADQASAAAPSAPRRTGTAASDGDETAPQEASAGHRLPPAATTAEDSGDARHQKATKQQKESPKRAPRASRVGSSLELEEEILARQSEISLQALELAGVYPSPARRLARLPWVTPGLVRAWIAALRANPKVRHVGAVLVTVLSDPDRCLPGPPGWQEEAQQEDEEAREEEPLQEGEHDPPEEEPSPSQDSAFPWEAVVARLRETLGEEAVAIWLAESYPLSAADGVLVVALRSAYAVDWMAARGYLPTCAALREVTGERWQVRFVVARGGP